MSMFEAPKKRHSEQQKKETEKSRVAPPSLLGASPSWLRTAVADLVRQREFPEGLSIQSAQISTVDVAKDVRDYHAQFDVLRNNNLPIYVVTMEYRSSQERLSIPVLIKVPDLDELFSSSYHEFLWALERSGLKPAAVSYGDAADVFIDRLSEFIFTRAADSGISSSPPVTIVETNRSGDTVLYAKGYFLSTGTAFGISTPATATLQSGRYSFGILESGVPRFENAVWSIPALGNIHLNLP